MSGGLEAEMVRHFGETRVLIVGDVMLDEYVWGDVRRISPAEDVEAVLHAR